MEVTDPYLVSQARRPLQQRFPRVLIDNEPARLGRHGPAGGGLLRGAGDGQLGGLRDRERRGCLLEAIVQLLLVCLGGRGVAV